ncbi:uncharacterized protein LOC135334774 isoform X2 [Halichondria panicea]|uniref:uncharacterized protein LOC135334774 isoform X2 n=1 Tax=Halichondria panicea TaxID=6063 RepID=UPI00312B8A80
MTSMLCGLVCVVLLSGLTALAGGQQVYLTLGSGPSITTDNTEILITAIGEDGSLPSLTCHTDLTTCCRSSDNNDNGALGQWTYPDGSVVLQKGGSATAGQQFYVLRGAPQVIRLARREASTNPVTPTGSYCCSVLTTGGDMTLCANLVAPVCSDNLPAISNGAITYASGSTNNRPVGATASYACFNPYRLVGVSVRTCGGDGEWSSTTAPVCQMICSDLPSLENGDIDYGGGGSTNSRPVNTVATYTCNPGYTLNGGTTRTCGSDGVWSGPAIDCQPDCPDLLLINGMIMYSAGSPGNRPFISTAVHSCNPGYTLTGGTFTTGTTRICLGGGKWSGSPPTCQRTCSDLPPLMNGGITYTGGLADSRPTATYTCDDGYTLTEGVSRACQNDGTWSGSAPTCQVNTGPTEPPTTCPDLTVPANGIISYNMGTASPRPVDTVATYTCIFRYTLNGDTTTRTCGSGVWSGSAPTCQRICFSLPPLTNGVITYSGGPTGISSDGSGATYSCNPGFTLNGGTTTRTCGSDGVWSGSEPTCQVNTGPTPSTCPDLTAPTNGMIGYDMETVNARPVNTVATYTCNTGYTLNGGITTMTCGSDGVWSDLESPPTCIVSCGNPPIIISGMMTSSTGTTFGAMATYTCNTGYQRSGSATITCQASGSWSTAPVCTALCDDLIVLANGVISYSPATTPRLEGAMATHSCTEGYGLSGGMERTCQSDRTWSGVIITCQQLPPVYVSVGTTNYAVMNSQVAIGTIGEADDQALICRTDNAQCCRGSDGLAAGEWSFPSGEVVPRRVDGNTSVPFFSSRDTGILRLHRRGSVSGPTGSYCAVIPDNTGVDMTFCVLIVTEVIITSPPPITTTTTTGGDTVPTAANSIGGVVAGVVIVLLILAAVIVVGIIVGVYFWRKLRGNQTKYSPSPRHAPPPRPTPYQASFKKSNGQDSKATIEKVDEPSIVEFPSDTHVTEGEEVYLRVKVGGHPPPSLTWYHDGRKVTADYATELYQDGGLSFPSVETKHAGVYKLVVTGASGSTTQQLVTVTVMSEGGEASEGVEGVDYAPIPVTEFGVYVADLHAGSNKKFKDLYKNLDSGERGHPVIISVTPENRVNNRFGNIAVYDDNLLVLQPIPGQEDCQSDYINACYVDGYKKPKKFIATQGPLPQTLVDFWRLMWQERPPIIVMLTNLKENNKIKCQPYWPESGKKQFGPFTVAITDQQILADYTIRTLEASLDGDRRVLRVKLFHFTAWPDHGVPDYATPILGFHRRVQSQHKPSKGPILIHCSAGVGRTGTYIAIDNVLDQISVEGLIDISGIIVKSRNQRMKLVQTQDQYVFIHDAILESVTCGDTQISAGDLRRQIQKMLSVAPGKTLSDFQYQFQILEQVTPNPKEVRSPIAVKNAARNRNMDYLPPETSRVILKGEQPDYIHAVFAHGYKHQKAYIIAQNPLDSTVRNFWKVIYDRKCAAVVMLTPLSENGKEACSQYWPESGNVTSFGEFTIDNLGEETNTGFVMRQLSVLNEKTQKAHQLTQFHITNWKSSGKCENLKTVTDVNEEVIKVQRRTGNKPVLVHCNDTATRSGMYCSVATTIDRCKTEGVVDVFQVVKALRVHKPGAVPSVVSSSAAYIEGGLYQIGNTNQTLPIQPVY